MNSPHLRDPTGRIIIGAAASPDEELLIGRGVTSILHDRSGLMIGVYIDNETPSRDTVARFVAGELPHKLVLVGLYPREQGYQIPGCITLLEWYPYHSYSILPIPRHPGGYILQWLYANDGDTPPTRRQRRTLLNRARLRRPTVLLVY